MFGSILEIKFNKFLINVRTKARFYLDLNVTLNKKQNKNGNKIKAH